jgi:hypothetical protein
LPPFGDDGEEQFQMPLEKLQKRSLKFPAKEKRKDSS